MPGGRDGGQWRGGTQDGTVQNGTAGAGTAAPGGAAGQGGMPGAMGWPGGMGGPGGLLNGSKPSEELSAMLEQDADRDTWVATTIGANNASGYQLATEERPVMPIGGFNGTDPSPMQEQFQR